MADTPSSSDDDGHLWVSWEEYHLLIEDLTLLVHASGWSFDHILCLARGGLRVGDVLSRVFDRPLAILATSSYRAGQGTEQGALDIATHITLASGTLGGRVLVVDDLVDSGVTLRAVCKELERRFPAVTQVRTAVLWSKPRSAMQPDYVACPLAGNPWIHQPFEEYDGLDANALKARRGR